MKPQQYRDLIQQFLDGKFGSAEEFARNYDKTFGSDPDQMTKEVFDILWSFFEDVEAYDPRWGPEDINEFRITEETLKIGALSAVEKLDEYIKNNPN